jgi:cell division protein FtsQ
MFEQIYVGDDFEIELIPKVGNHKILIGNIENLDDKFSRLLLFYKQGLMRKGWENYSVINLKFKNQVVCTKNIHQTIKQDNL